MALQQCRLGAIGNALQWDDGDFTGAIETTQVIKAGAPVAANDVLILSEFVEPPAEQVSSPAVITDHAVVRGDGGVREIQDSGILIDDNDTITLTGGLISTTTRYTTTQVIPVTDIVVFCNTDGAAWTATLPAGAEGQTFRIINSGSSSNNLTIAPNGAEHLIGANTNFILSDGEVLEITYNATDGWY